MLPGLSAPGCELASRGSSVRSCFARALVKFMGGVVFSTLGRSSSIASGAGDSCAGSAPRSALSSPSSACPASSVGVGSASLSGTIAGGLKANASEAWFIMWVAIGGGGVRRCP